MLRARILAIACLSVFALTGCSASSDDAPASGNPNPATPPSGATAEAGGLSGAALCDYLRGELPKVKSIGSKVGAEAQLAVGLADFFSKAGKPADGGQMDELTTKDCPDVRTEVLAAIGKGAFAEL